MSQIDHCIAAAVQMVASSDSLVGKSLRVGGALFPRSQASRGMREHGRHVPGMMIASWKRPDWARASGACKATGCTDHTVTATPWFSTASCGMVC